MALGLRVIVSVTPRFNPLLTTPHPQNRGEQPVRATGDLTFQKARGPLLAVGEREMGRKETQRNLCQGPCGGRSLPLQEEDLMASPTPSRARSLHDRRAVHKGQTRPTLSGQTFTRD